MTASASTSIAHLILDKHGRNGTTRQLHECCAQRAASNLVICIPAVGAWAVELVLVPCVAVVLCSLWQQGCLLSARHFLVVSSIGVLHTLHHPVKGQIGNVNIIYNLSLLPDETGGQVDDAVDRCLGNGQPCDEFQGLGQRQVVLLWAACAAKDKVLPAAVVVRACKRDAQLFREVMAGQTALTWRSIEALYGT